MNARQRLAIVAVASVFILGLLACETGYNRIPTPKPQSGQYRGAEEARGHHCINQESLIHDGFWELTYTSAYQAVGRIYYDRTWDEDGNIVEGGYLNPANIESIESGFSFGQLRWGRRVLSLSLLLWVTNPWHQYQPYQSSSNIRGDYEGGGVRRPDDVSIGATIVRHYAEGYMDEETCEITYYRSY